MKTRLLIFAPVLMCAAMLFSCTKEIELPIDNNTKVNDYVITAYSESSATKAELSDKSIIWQDGDEISVLSNTTANDKFVLTGGQQTTSGTFGGSLSNPEIPHIGVYPYNKDSFYGEIGSIIWGKNIQIATEEDFDPTACLMAGKLDSEGKINFKNICSYIKVETDFACTSIEITSSGNPLVSERVLITLGEGGIPSVIEPDGNNETYQTVKLVGQYDKEGKSKLIPAGTYYVAVLPQTYSGLTFTFNTEFGTKIVKSTRTGVDITINRNAIVIVGSFTLDNLLPIGISGFAGSGTKDDPYLISSLAKLQLLASKFVDHKNYDDLPYTKDTYFLQTKDIDCEGKEISIGTMWYNGETDAMPYYPFNGIYDGGGYTISNYKLKECYGGAGKRYAGLFNNIYQGTIKNLTVAPATIGENGEIIVSDDNNKLYVGALIGAAGNKHDNNVTGAGSEIIVSNCHLIGGPYRINASRAKVFGGLVGYSGGDKFRLENCSNNASLYTADGSGSDNGSENVLGGLIGEVTLSYYNGEGLTAHRPLLEIAKCRNNGTIRAESRYLSCFAGGLVGLWCDNNSASYAWNNLEAHVSNSVNSGNVYTSSQLNQSGYRYLDVSETCGPSCAGGFFGFFGMDESTSYFHNCLNKGLIEAYATNTTNNKYARAGGFLGFSKENNNTSQNPTQDGSKDHVYAAMCVNTGSIKGHTNNVGSFCGTINGLKCVNCIWLDKHNYTDGVRAAMPYRPELDQQAGGNYDAEHDVYYYNTINTKTISAAFMKMIKERQCKYDNNKFVLRWGYIDGDDQDGGWKFWTAAWTGEANWNGANNLDLDFNSLIDVQIAE